MRIRSIKPEFWRSDDITDLPLEDRLLFIGMWSYVDDNGVGVDKLSSIAADLFAHDLSVSPHDTLTRIERGLTRLHTDGLIERYTVGSKRYLHVTNWARHQRINRPSPGRYPLPGDGSALPPEPLTEDSVSPQPDATPGTGEQRNRGTGEQSSPPKSERAEEPRPEVEALCNLLADRLVANGANRPTINKEWRDSARLMIDKDKHTPEQIAWIINWAQNDDFWKSNAMSMRAIRKQFDRFKLKALSEQRPQKSKTQQEIDEWLSKPITPTLLEVTQ